MNEKVQQYLVIFVGVIVIGGVIYFQVRRARPAPPVSATVASTETVPGAASLPPALSEAPPPPIAGVQLTPGPALEGIQLPTAETLLLQTGEWGRDPFITFDELAALQPEPIVLEIVDIPPVLPPTEEPSALPDYRVTVIDSGVDVRTTTPAPTTTERLSNRNNRRRHCGRHSPGRTPSRRAGATTSGGTT